MSDIALANSEVIEWAQNVEHAAGDTSLQISEGGLAEAYTRKTMREPMSTGPGNVVVLDCLVG